MLIFNCLENRRINVNGYGTKVCFISTKNVIRNISYCVNM
jgi:hypothetical protein